MLAVAIVLTLAVGGTGVWLAGNYQPLRADSGGAPTFVHSQDLRRIFALSPRDGKPLIAYDVPYQDGERISYGFTLYNDGPVDVVVLKVSQLGGDPIRITSIAMGKAEGTPGRERDAALPFRPFKLPAHTSKFIVVEGLFVGCSMNGEPGEPDAVIISRMPVVFRLFGITRNAVIPLPYSIRSSGHQGCIVF